MAMLNPTRLQRCIFPISVLAFAIILSLIVVFGGEGQELAPRHDGDEFWVLAISIGLGVMSFFAMIRARPRRWTDVLLAFGGSAATAFACCPVAGITLQRVHEIADFHGRDLVEHERAVPIVSASIHRYKGVSYQVWLDQYAALVTVDRRDYLAAFGEVERVRPKGYCVRAIVQTAGTASRIMALPGKSLPVGSLVRCGDRVNTGIVRSRSGDETTAWARALASPAPAAPAAP